MNGKIRLAEGGGGEATASLIRELFWSRFRHPQLLRGNDAAVLEHAGGRLALTTDAFVVTPWRFPGGDIGRLAIAGTVNDLTMMGAAALGLTAAFIIEEGFDKSDLEQIAASMAAAAAEAGVDLVAGDTKVVRKGEADGIFITTTGVGTIAPGVRLGGELARPGDRVLVTGTLGDHGAAILLAREELGLSGALQSDVAPLNRLLLPLVGEYPGAIRVLRDPTRGGLATTLNEIARQSGVAIRLREAAIPVRPEVRGLTELLGLDPLYLANEGKALLVVAPEAADAILAALRRQPRGSRAAEVGEVLAGNAGLVSLVTASGGERIIPLGSGEQLPRIC
ncbi:hydrogenase maturation carbamoyl dehydratase HypE [Hydrogenispora ethanolica]|uniref:Hydrogenase maturation carbamoyl dehydratase HypE n=1 Tax=Hydrogenispora ethanolica TaxID=1082276 RepID=A0A4R1RN80_HYDET|nr:hydrogenase expression/formation protein HypE [Hydrogenispora ethanolica]TCL67360.1 hydrogenase maturation carbamoyl dehydratase HypE [Hydrogenispora ethanolica]